MMKVTDYVEIFNDTQKLYTEDSELIESLEFSKKNVKFYGADDYPEISRSGYKKGEITISKSRTFQAVMNLHSEFPSKKIAVLNFASATHPGGGVLHGAKAQEESLCRCSTLYPTLNTPDNWRDYYNVNRENGSPLHSDACIYSPGITIFKSDERYPEVMDRKDWVTADVITCAAPNLYYKPYSWNNPETGKLMNMDYEELLMLHMKRARHILTVAVVNNVDILILGAFGCGAFRNDPDTVAKAYKNVIEEYRNYFDRIEFAIFCRDYENRNYSAFRKALLGEE